MDEVLEALGEGCLYVLIAFALALFVCAPMISAAYEANKQKKKREKRDEEERHRQREIARDCGYEALGTYLRITNQENRRGRRY